MKRKLQFIILCCLLAVSLASCRSAGSSTAESKEEHTNAKPETADDAAGPEDGTEYGSTESITGNTTGDASQSLKDEDADKESVTGNTAGDASKSANAASESASTASEGISKEPGGNEIPDEPQEERVMNIQIGEQTFQAVLYENESTKALQEKLPMTIRMDEMNGNEKYYFMDENIPSASETVGSIQAGDIMLFGSNCLVLFFKDFQTSYTYTRLGYVRNAPEFVSALESGSLEVTFRMEG